MYICMYMHTYICTPDLGFYNAAGVEKGGTGVKIHTLDRYGKPIPL